MQDTNLLSNDLAPIEDALNRLTQSPLGQRTLRSMRNWLVDARGCDLSDSERLSALRLCYALLRSGNRNECLAMLCKKAGEL